MIRVARTEPIPVTLVDSVETTTAVVGATSDAKAFSFTRACFLLNVTASGGHAGDVLDVYVDVLGPDATTWLNAIHFTQIAGNSAAIKHWAILESSNTAATTFDVTSDCNAGVTKPYLFGSKMRARWTMVNAGTVGSVTWSLKALVER
jgi:hypothetical protein